jgi:trigger factor
MKSELTDVNETRKDMRVEIAPDVVSAEMDRLVREYSRRVRIPGFRPGKAPARVVKQRFKDQILAELANDLIPRAVDDALRERGVESVDVPDIRDVTIEEGQPLTFTASFDTVPSFDPGDYTTLSLPHQGVRVEDEAVGLAMERLRGRMARHEPVEGRAAELGDTLIVDLERTQKPRPGETDTPPSTEKREDVSLEIGAKVNPPGFDDHLIGIEAGATRSFTIQYPADFAVADLAGVEVLFTVTVKSIKRKVLPELDDEFAKDLGNFETLEALRARVRADLEEEARRTAERETRAALMKQLAARVPFEPPPSLVERELNRRIEGFAHGLMEQQIDPRKAGIDWNAFRDSQREVAREAVASSLVLDEVARREKLDVTEDEIEQEIARHAERSGRTPAAVRAVLEKEGGVSRVQAGLRREKTIDFLTARARIT